MTKYYTNVFQIKSDIYHYYFENGKRKQEKIRFKPVLGVPTEEKTGWTDIHGNNVGPIQFDSIFQMYSWRKENEDLKDEIYGDIAPIYQFLTGKYTKELEPDYVNIYRVLNLDIEVDSIDGFPYPEQANYPVTAITGHDLYKNVFYVFGTKPYTPKADNVKYILCKDEENLLTKFINFVNKFRPDIITGWNTFGFDIPYIVNRAKKILERGYWKLLSPVGVVSEKKGKTPMDPDGYNIVGVSHLDYMVLYKKFTPEKRESYSLNAISGIELDEQKVNYHEEYENLADLLRKNYTLYIDYNIRDTELIGLINDKCKFIELAITLAYLAKVNFDDVFGSVKIWDCLVYNEMYHQKMMINPKKAYPNREDFPGGFVKEPDPGLREWLVVFDITSSYPNQIVSGNLSPETLIERPPGELLKITNQLEKIDGYVSPEKLKLIGLTDLLKKENLSVASNGQFFNRNKKGLFPKIVDRILTNRKILKKKAKVLYGELETMKKDSKSELEIEKKQEEYYSTDAKQNAIKIMMNSFYGVFANIYFRWYDLRLASAVTSNGQVCLKGPIQYLEQNAPKIDIIYGDTDSVFMGMTKILAGRFKDKKVSPEEKREFLVKFSNEYVNPLISQYYENMTDAMNMPRNTFEMDFETIADKTIMTGPKKRYIMNKVWDDGYLVPFDGKPKLKIRGIEIRRSSTPMVAREFLTDLVNLVIKSGDNNTCIDFIDEFREKWDKMDFDEVSNPRGVNGMDKYTMESKGKPIQVRASLLYNQALKDFKLKRYPIIRSGDKIKYTYVKVPNHFNQNVIGFINKFPKEFRGVFEIDHKLQFEKSVLSPIQSIFNALGWFTEKSNSIADFF